MVDEEIEAICADIAKRDPTFKASVRTTFSRAPFGTAMEAEIVRIVSGAVRDRIGHEPEYRGMTFWADSGILSGAGIPTVLFGPGGAGLHSAVEYVNVDDVLVCADVLARTAIAFCG